MGVTAPLHCASVLVKLENQEDGGETGDISISRPTTASANNQGVAIMRSFQVQSVFKQSSPAFTQFFQTDRHDYRFWQAAILHLQCGR